MKTNEKLLYGGLGVAALFLLASNRTAKAYANTPSAISGSASGASVKAVGAGKSQTPQTRDPITQAALNAQKAVQAAPKVLYGAAGATVAASQKAGTDLFKAMNTAYTDWRRASWIEQKDFEAAEARKRLLAEQEARRKQEIAKQNAAARAYWGW